MSEPDIVISKQVFRRYRLGLSGVWPGRRWRGKRGVAEAIMALGGVQVDPVTVVARNHDLVLYNRVADYKPEYLDQLLYKDREFFDYGGGLVISPIEELPYMRVVMKRRATEPRQMKTLAEHQETIDFVRRELAERGPLGNRDFEGQARVTNYRARKDTGLALYYLWLTGEAMTHHRTSSFERVYALNDQVAPPALDYTASDEEAEAFYADRASIRPATLRTWRLRYAGMISRPVSMEEARQQVERRHNEGQLATFKVEGSRDIYYFAANDRPILNALIAGDVPAAWKAQDTTTDEEARFLPPLDPLVAHGAAKLIFDFYYIWEIYKPQEKRRWGYYTMPILLGDDLIGRIDSRLDRANKTLVVNGLWLEPTVTMTEETIAAIQVGLRRFADFHGAEATDLQAVEPLTLRQSLTV